MNRVTATDGYNVSNLSSDDVELPLLAECLAEVLRALPSPGTKLEVNRCGRLTAGEELRIIRAVEAAAAKHGCRPTAPLCTRLVAGSVVVEPIW